MKGGNHDNIVTEEIFIKLNAKCVTGKDVFLSIVTKGSALVHIKHEES